MIKLLLLLLPLSLFAQEPSGTLTDSRLMGLAQAGVSEAELSRLVAAAPKVDFDLQPVATDAMMKAGISENVIKAMAARLYGKPTDMSPARVSPPTPDSAPKMAA